MKNIFKSRVALYVFFSFLFYFWWKISSFELSMIIAIGTIIGEQTYLSIISLEKNKKNDEED